jgi:hypothetical protein
VHQAIAHLEQLAQMRHDLIPFVEQRSVRPRDRLDVLPPDRQAVDLPERRTRQLSLEMNGQKVVHERLRRERREEGRRATEPLLRDLGERPPHPRRIAWSERPDAARREHRLGRACVVERIKSLREMSGRERARCRPSHPSQFLLDPLTISLDQHTPRLDRPTDRHRRLSARSASTIDDDASRYALRAEPRPHSSSRQIGHTSGHLEHKMLPKNHCFAGSSSIPAPRSTRSRTRHSKVVRETRRFAGIS